MNTPDDERLKQHFEKMRDADRRKVPDFLDTISAARFRTLPSRWHRRIAFAAALLLGVAASIMVSQLHRSTAPPEPLMSWSSPTSSLLETPGKRLLRETPPLGVQSIYGLPAAGKDRR